MDLGSGIRDPGSGKNLFRIPDPGVKKAPDPGSGSATLQKTKKCHHLKTNSLHSDFLSVVNPNLDLDPYGSAMILALVDPEPNPYWGCGSGSRSRGKEIYQNLPIKTDSNKKKA
jgi:hypothetical protein